MATEITAIRADTAWLAGLDAWAERNGLSRAAAIRILVLVGMRALDDPRISPEQLERLITDE